MDDWLSVAGFGGSTLFAAACAYKILRPKFPVRVNCWFCNTDTVVPYGNQNCWDCPKCEQYNGFDKTGGYNKEIPAQFMEELNHGVGCAADEYLEGSSGLCQACEQNQLLKVKQLASFVPMIEDNYDAEVDAYKEHLEQIYELCDTCRSVVDRELYKQDDALRVRLEANRFNSSTQSEQQQASMMSFTTELPTCKQRLGYVLGLMCLLCACLVLAYHLPQSQATLLYTVVLAQFVQAMQIYTQLLHYAGLVFCLASKLLIGKEKMRIIDVCSCFIWLLCAVTETREVTLLLPPIPAQEQVLVSLFSLNFLLSLTCCVIGRERNTNTNLTFKRLSLDKSTGSTLSETDTVAVSSVSTSRRAQPDPEPTAVVEEPMDDLDLDLDAFSLGPKTGGMKRSDSGMFSMAGSQASFAPASAVPRPLLGQPRPLISPARLTVRMSSSTPTNGFNTASQRPSTMNPAFDMKSRQSLNFSSMQKPAPENNIFLQQGLTTEKLSLFNTQQSDQTTNQIQGQSSPLRSNLWQHANFAKTHLSPDKLSQCHFSSQDSQVSMSISSHADTFRTTSRPNTPIRKSLWQQGVVEPKAAPLSESNVFRLEKSNVFQLKGKPNVFQHPNVFQLKDKRLNDSSVFDNDTTGFMTCLEGSELRERAVHSGKDDNLRTEDSSKSSECPVDSTTLTPPGKYINLKKFGIGAVLVASVVGNAILGVYLFTKS